MRIVIEIPDRVHYGIEKGITVNGSSASQIVLDAVRNGTPLPEHYGRLIDADKAESMLKNHAKSESEAWALVELLNVLDEVPTVLEATKEEPHVKVGKETYYY